jgi:DNA-binding transcriptional ArsR family regulator
MARAATTTDVFNAIAEPRRRELLDALAAGTPRDVSDLATALRWPQPDVSKHLAVLRQVGLVSMTKDAKRRLYRLEPQELKRVHDWVKSYEHFWSRQLDRIKARAERMAQSRTDSARGNLPDSPDTRPET